MALSINTNLFALNAQRNLRKSETPLATAMQRLSSTLRINSAKDDAAGLAIATRMTTQINGLTVAMRNANDGVSFSQTAEGAMDEMINALQRIYELSNQAASYNTSSDRNSMNQEVSQLVAELNRIVTQTKYNGEQFLNQAKSIDIQVGVDVKETINISTSNVSPNTMGIATSYTDSLTGADIAKSAYLTAQSGGLSANATINGYDIGDAIGSASVKNNSLELINRINLYTGTTGVTAFGYGNALVGATAAVSVTTGSIAGVSAGYLTINGTQIGSFDLTSSAGTDVTNLLSAINAKSATTGVTAYAVDKTDFTVSSTGNASSIIVLTNTTGAAISVSRNDSAIASGSLSNVLASATMSVSAGGNGKIIFNDSFTKSTTTFDASDTTVAFGVSSTGTSVSLTATSANSVSVTSVANANITILVAKQALDTITSQKATLGAVQNRLASTIANLDNVRENITAARSRIMDADFAVETANLTKAMIMQQAGISVLSQANTLPQNVLALLGGR